MGEDKKQLILVTLEEYMHTSTVDLEDVAPDLFSEIQDNWAVITILVVSVFWIIPILSDTSVI